MLRDDAVDAPVEPQPTLNEVGALVEESRRLGLAVALEVDRSKPALEPAVEVTAYRILQEALTNVRKHACARSVQVRVQHDDGWLRLRVADDGIGITAGSRTGGHGLVGMRERVEVYGGRLTLTAPPDGGCVLDVALPLGSELVP